MQRRLLSPDDASRRGVLVCARQAAAAAATTTADRQTHARRREREREREKQTRRPAPGLQPLLTSARSPALALSHSISLPFPRLPPSSSSRRASSSSCCHHTCPGLSDWVSQCPPQLSPPSSPHRKSGWRPMVASRTPGGRRGKRRLTARASGRNPSPHEAVAEEADVVVVAAAAATAAAAEAAPSAVAAAAAADDDEDCEAATSPAARAGAGGADQQPESGDADTDVEDQDAKKRLTLQEVKRASRSAGETREGGTRDECRACVGV